MTEESYKDPEMSLEFSLERALLELVEIEDWKDIAIHLGLPEYVANGIEQTYSGKVRQKREAILWWIKNSPTASWKELADALYKAGYFLTASHIVTMLMKGPADDELTEQGSLEFCANVIKHMQKSGTINRFLAHLVFVGLPGSGKTTLIARLLKLKEVEKLLQASGSTGVMDGIITVDVAEDEASMYAANLNANYEWNKVEFGISCLRQMGINCFALRQPSHDYGNKEPANSSSFPSKAGSKISPVDVMAKIRTLLNDNGFSAIRPFLDKKSTLYLSDTGGQIEFQELLPLLVAGIAIFVFVFPLHLDLDAPVPVSYRTKIGDEIEHSNVYTSFLTIKESFLQTLASIDSMESRKGSSIAKHNPYVFVVGTHKDFLTKKIGENDTRKKITEINGELENLIDDHHYANLVVYADKSKSEVLFAVDNTSENEVFANIRKSIIELLHSGNEFQIQFPLSYLLASLHLQDSCKPFIRRSEFAQYVLQYGIEEEDVDHLLEFLHTRIGQIRYFPIEGIKDIIVKEPQALYNLVTEVIIKSFVLRSVTMKEHSETQRGIYSLKSFDARQVESQPEFLTPKQIVHLLKELRIVAPFYDRAGGVEKYFIPCIINHIENSPVDDHERKILTVQSLAIMFDCGHCPKGMFGVLLHYILTQQDTMLNWNLGINKIFRDQVSFEVGPYEDLVTIKFRTTHLEVTLSSITSIPQHTEAFTLKKTCNMIRYTLVSGIEEATKSLNYSPEKTRHSLGLVCSDCDTIHQVSEVNSQFMMKCSQSGEGYSIIPEPECLWFGAPPYVSFPDLHNHTITLKQGSNRRMNFDVVSCASLDLKLQNTHYLSKQGEISEDSCSLYIQGTTVHLKDVKRIDAGKYYLNSCNAAGTGRALFFLKIKAPPSYSLESDYLEAEAGSTLSVSFTVTSDPPLAEGTEHTLSKRGEGEVTPRFKVESNCITFRRVRVEDSGVYTISCCSDKGEVGEAAFELDVTPTQYYTSGNHPKIGTIVKSEDINFLLRLLHKYAYKWKEIGSSLNFHPGELENIGQHFPAGATPQQCLRVLLSQWSQWPTTDYSDSPTLERLCDALRSSLVGLGAKANQLYELRCDLPSQASRVPSQAADQTQDSEVKCCIIL